MLFNRIVLGAFVLAVMLLAPEYVHAANGIDTDGTDLPINVGGAPVAAFTGSKNLDVVGGVKVGDQTKVSVCDATRSGTLRFNSTPGKNVMEYCNGTAWIQIGG